MLDGPSKRLLGSVAALLALGLIAGGVWVAASGGDEPRPAATPSASPMPSPEQAASPTPVHSLSVRLRRVRGIGLARKIRPRHLARPAQAVRQTMTDLYSTAFIDTTKWADGRFPRLPGFFVGEARKQARRDLKRLSLGPAARHLSAVRPIRARMDVRLAVDGRRRPIAALASMEFVGAGLAEGVEVPVRHRGDYVLRKARGAWRVASYDVRGSVPPPGEIARRVEASFAPGVPSRDLLFFLAIGSDARPGQSVAGLRADSLHIIGVNPKRGGAAIVGIPRDSFVPIPGVGTRKINESLFYGGPELAVRTVENLTGIDIDGYLLTGFEDFRHLVTAVGGIKVRIPYAMSDRYSGAYFRPGKKRLRGPEALAFSRNRYDAPGGDFGRSMNQGRLILAALREFRQDLRKDPMTLLRWLVAGARHVRTDLSLSEALELLLAAPTVDPGKVRNQVVSGHGAMVGGQSVVRLGAGAHAIFRDLRRDAMLGG